MPGAYTSLQIWLEISGTKLLSTLPTHMWLSFDAFIFFHIMNQYCVIGVVNNDIESQFVSPVSKVNFNRPFPLGKTGFNT